MKPGSAKDACFFLFARLAGHMLLQELRWAMLMHQGLIEGAINATEQPL